MEPIHAPTRALEGGIVAALVICLAGCSSARTQQQPAPAPGSEREAEPRPAPSSASVAPGTTTESAKGPTSPASPSSSAASPGACPAGMLLVDGDYCDKLDMTCLKSWYADWNKKVVCERFEEPTRCVGATSKKRFCIDRYEFPNKKGERPEVWNNFYEAQVICAGLGRRVCTESEWTMACEGPARKPFPYGYVRDSKKCNGDRPYDFPSKKKLWARDPVESERLWQGVPIGSQPECVSDYGVFDLPGNADELAASERPGHYDNVTTGGPWYLGVRNQCRPKIYTHDESFAYYYLSFRCCAEPDGKPSDPRSPKQIKRRMKWETVERFAKGSLSFKPRAK